MSISVIIPTLRRNEGLAAAVQSLHAVHDNTPVHQVVVVDNSPDADARQTAQALAATAPFPLDYVHAPQPGVSNARNAGVARATGSFIAFLDDDERAQPQWLAELCRVQREYDADVVFGAILGTAPQCTPSLRPVVERFFSRSGPAEACVTDIPYGCGNSLLRKTTTLSPDAFDPSANHTGGEDDILFAKLKRDGRVFAWAPQAIVYEDAPLQRSNLKYLLIRAFARGQGPSQTAVAASAYPELIGWMAVGLVQFGMYGLAALLCGVALTSTGASFATRAAEGAGKLLWFRAFEPKLYGSA